MFSVLFLVIYNLPVQAQVLIVDDAKRMAELLGTTAYRPSASEVQKHYLGKASEGLVRFMATRGGDSEQMTKAVLGRQPEYRRAVEICLPVALSQQVVLKQRLKQVQLLLGQTTPVKAYIVIGTGRSGGTADQDSVVLALEVLCRFAETPDEAVEVLESSLMHELVHHYRFKTASFTGTDNLLRQAMVEGFADFVPQLLLERISPVEQYRDAYGLVHEPGVWARFKSDRKNVSLGSWMYAPGPEGEPADMGYWIGKRISESYYLRAADKSQAIMNLLLLDDPEALLKASGYDPR